MAVRRLRKHVAELEVTAVGRDERSLALGVCAPQHEHHGPRSLGHLADDSVGELLVLPAGLHGTNGSLGVGVVVGREPGVDGLLNSGGEGHRKKRKGISVGPRTAVKERGLGEKRQRRA